MRQRIGLSCIIALLMWEEFAFLSYVMRRTRQALDHFGLNPYQVTIHETNFEIHLSLDGRTSRMIFMSRPWKAP